MKDKIRVFQLIKSLGRGGAEVLLSTGHRNADLARFHYGYGYFLPWKDAMVPELTAQGAEVTCFDASTRPGILLAARKVARHLKQWDADVLHCHLPLAGICGRIAGRLAGVPVVYTGHMEVEYNHPLTRWLNLVTWSMQNHVVAVSEGSGASARKNAGERIPITVVQNGVDTEVFAPGRYDGTEVRRQFGIPEGAPLVGTVAVFRRQKQLHHWVHVAKRVHDRVPEARFLIIGEGPLRMDVETAIHELGLNEVVHLAGFQEDVKPFLAAMDIYLMTSLIEGLPIALLEAMAMGLPVVSTSVGGIPEVVKEGAGFLVPLEIKSDEIDRYMQREVKGIEPGLGDVDLLADPLVRLSSDSELRRRMSSNARAIVEERFSMRRMMEELECIYAELAGRKRDG